MDIILYYPYINLYKKSYGPIYLYKVTERKTLIEKQVISLNKLFDSPNINLVVGPKYKKIKNLFSLHKNIEILENKDYENVNDLHNLGIGIQNIKKNCLIIQGNILLSHNFLKKMNKNQSQMFLTSKQNFDLGCILNINNDIENISWSLPLSWTNISYFCNKELELLKNISIKQETKNWFIFEAINWIIKNNGKIIGNKINAKLNIIERPINHA